MIEQLAELVDGIAHVGAQHVLAKKLMEHLPDGAFQKRHAATVAGTVPRIAAVLRVIGQRLKKRRRQAV